MPSWREGESEESLQDWARRNEEVNVAVLSAVNAMMPFVGFPKWESWEKAAEYLNGLAATWAATAPWHMSTIRHIVEATATEMLETGRKRA